MIRHQRREKSCPITRIKLESEKKKLYEEKKNWVNDQNDVKIHVKLSQRFRVIGKRLCPLQNSILHEHISSIVVVLRRLRNTHEGIVWMAILYWICILFSFSIFLSSWILTLLCTLCPDNMISCPLQQPLSLKGLRGKKLKC